MNKELHSKVLEIDHQFIDQWYQQSTIRCGICTKRKIEHKYYKNNAKFFDTDSGVFITCRKCNQTYTLNKYLQEAHSQGREHSIARWRIGSTGWNFNCPHPPKDFLDQIKKKRRESYRQQEESLKKMNYLRKYGKLP